METTTNNNIKIVRLQSGEDIIADFIEFQEEDVVKLDNPMHIIFKRIPSGQTVMVMLPWLPIEIIKENNAVIYTSDILTVIEPKEHLIKYYSEMVIETHIRLEKEQENIKKGFETSEIEDELIELLKDKRKGKIH
jgi:hypothetical protein